MPLKWDWSCPLITSLIKAFAIKAKTEQSLHYRRNLHKYQLSVGKFFEQLVFCLACAQWAPYRRRWWCVPPKMLEPDRRHSSYGCDQLTLCRFCPAAPPTVYVWKQHVCATAQPGCDGVWVREGDRSGESKHFITVEWRRTLQASSLWVNALEPRKRPSLASCLLPLYLTPLAKQRFSKTHHPGKSCVEGTAEQQFLEFESVFLWSSDKLKLPGIWQWVFKQIWLAFLI